MAAIDLDHTSGLVPIFPLPDMALLPGELMPLYIFEPRYRRMVADALAGDRLIAMARFEPGWEDSYYGNPDVKKVMGLGTVVAHKSQQDGSSEIVLKGLARVTLLEVVREMPYRLGRVDTMPEAVSDPAKLKQLTGEIFGMLETLCGQHDHPFADAECTGLPLEELPGRLVPLLQYDPETKQKLLACDDIVCRLEVVLKGLKSRERQVRMAQLLRNKLAPKPN
jgi:Lon protease-like protein